MEYSNDANTQYVPVAIYLMNPRFLQRFSVVKVLGLHDTSTAARVTCDSIIKILIMCLAITFGLAAFFRHSTNLVTEPERGLRSLLQEPG